ncbi:hypothetical protein NQ315_002864 [Exocentrus adspersus]|uniref:DDE Tnp4 domain-containing protein n=1 Tax=Exocentrus adspersus TaxID=1586481 RepID=A0AAV8V875_9CUCU|nr:hypothetical protein NQ315_002864 [Exocentrus adspersus]
MKKVLDFLLSQKSSVIQWPDANTAREIEGRFRMMKGIRNVIGYIDGSHIEISKPKENQESYYNRKGYHSLLLQSIVNCNKKFIDVFCDTYSRGQKKVSNLKPELWDF